MLDIISTATRFRCLDFRPTVLDAACIPATKFGLVNDRFALRGIVSDSPAFSARTTCWASPEKPPSMIPEQVTIALEDVFRSKDYSRFQKNIDIASAYLKIPAMKLGFFLMSFLPYRHFLKEEPVEESIHALCLLFRLVNQNPHLDILSFFNVTNWQARPYRSTQTFSEVIDHSVASSQLYYRLGLSPHVLPDIPVRAVPAWDHGAFEPFITVELANGRYKLQIQQGDQESHGGFLFRLCLPDGGLIAKMGVNIDAKSCHIMNIQGVAEVFRAHVNKLREVFNGRNPFDWLLDNIKVWAKLEGMNRLVGYGVQLQLWITDRPNYGTPPPPEAMAGFLRNYDKRYESHGLSQIGTSGVFVGDIRIVQPQPNDFVITKAMRQAEAAA